MTAAKIIAIAFLAGCTLAPPPQDVPVNPNIGVGVDSPASPLRLTVFADYGCVRCAELFDLLTTLVPAYKGRIVVTYRDYITPGINAGAYAAALGARCAAEQGKGERFAAAAYGYAGDWTALPAEQLASWAAEVQADVPRFDLCVREKRPAASIAADVEDAKLLKVTKTPSLFLGSAPIEDPGSPEEWKALFDRSVNAVGRRDVEEE